MNEEQQKKKIRLKVDLYNQAREYGYSKDKATSLSNRKVELEPSITKAKRNMQMGRILPITILEEASTRLFRAPWKGCTKAQKKEVVWALGGNSNKPFSEDVCCYQWGGGVVCGRVVWCDERTDKEWVNTRLPDGSSAASDEAKYSRRKGGYGLQTGMNMWDYTIQASKRSRDFGRVM